MPSKTACVEALFHLLGLAIVIPRAPTQTVGSSKIIVCPTCLPNGACCTPFLILPLTPTGHQLVLDYMTTSSLGREERKLAFAVLKPESFALVDWGETAEAGGGK